MLLNYTDSQDSMHKVSAVSPVVAKHAHGQMKWPCPGATHREYISQAEPVYVACTNVSVWMLAALFFEGHRVGGKSVTELEKHKISNSVMWKHFSCVVCLSYIVLSWIYDDAFCLINGRQSKSFPWSLHLSDPVNE